MTQYQCHWHQVGLPQQARWEWSGDKEQGKVGCSRFHSSRGLGLWRNICTGGKTWSNSNASSLCRSSQLQAISNGCEECISQWPYSRTCLCWATNLALFLVITPFSSCLLQKTHLVPMTLVLGCSTKVHTWFLSKLLSSSCMAITQFGSPSACSTLRGFKEETNE